jgi:hypothetical protein
VLLVFTVPFYSLSKAIRAPELTNFLFVDLQVFYGVLVLAFVVKLLIFSSMAFHSNTFTNYPWALQPQYIFTSH